jgi:nitrogen fixation/metabolism regulation signal transduction histidine kinase
MRISLAARFSLVTGVLVALAVGLSLGLHYLLPDAPVLVASLTLFLMLPLTIYSIRQALRRMLAMFRAIEGTVLSYQDGDYSFGLHWPRNDEIGDLIDAHNALGDVLREQRLALVQRELLLDTMVQNTPVAMLLVCDGGPVVFANIAARQLLNQGRRLEGHTLHEILKSATVSLRDAVERGGDGLFTVRQEAGPDDEDDIYHLARRQFSLNGRRHELLLLRHLTVELRRQEVQTWKKVIRVISHELNNSLAPVASLASSGAELVRRGQTERLPAVLKTIEDRTRHLETFIAGYAHFAKLPIPRLESVDWADFIAAMQSQVVFAFFGSLPEEPTRFDAGQMEQALINLLKNAHESGGLPQEVSLSIRRIPGSIVIEVSDRGAGMSDTVMSNALVPFYSTKRTGSGLGLALAREIIEAHDGRISINNREGGGLTVALILPG